MSGDFVYAIIRNVGNINSALGALSKIDCIDADAVAHDSYQLGQPPDYRRSNLGRPATKNDFGTFRRGDNFFFGASCGLD